MRYDFKPDVRVILALGLLCSLVGLAWLIGWAGVSALSLILLMGWLAFAVVAVPLARTPTTAWLITAAVAAVCLRVFIAWLTHGANTAQSDPMFYEQIARNLLAGDGLVVHMSGLPDFRALYPPAYPVLLAGAIALLPAYAALTLNSLIHVLGSAVLYRLVGGRGALPAAYLFLIWPSFVVGASIPTKEGLVCLFLLLSIIPILKGEGSAKNALLFGASVALLGMTQPALSTLPPLLSLILWHRIGSLAFARFAAIAAATLIIVMLPWWIRNYLVLGDFVPLTSGMGFNLHYAVIGDNFPAWLNALPEKEFSAAAGQLAVAQLTADPTLYLFTQVKQAFISMGLDHAYIEVMSWLSSPASLNPYALALVLQVPFVLLWSASLRKGTREWQWILLLTFTHFALVNVWFQFGQRHRVILIPLLLAWVFSVLKPQRSQLPARS